MKNILGLLLLILFSLYSYSYSDEWKKVIDEHRKMKEAFTIHLNNGYALHLEKDSIYYFERYVASDDNSTVNWLEHNRVDNEPFDTTRNKSKKVK